MLTTLILLSTFVIVPHVQAQHQTSAKLFDNCSALDKTPEKIAETLVSESYCAGYISGVVDGYRITTDLYPQIKFICLPQKGISNEEVISIFKKWFKERPKEKETPARSGVLLSLREKYPCK